jgi:hypothetical protein
MMANQFFAFLFIIVYLVISGYGFYLSRQLKPKKEELGARAPTELFQGVLASLYPVLVHFGSL